MEKQIVLDKKQKQNQVFRSMLDGFNFTFKLEGVSAKLYGFQPSRYQDSKKPIPMLEFNLNLVAVIVSIQKELLSAEIYLKEILLTQYLKRELMRAFSRQVNSNVGNNLVTSIYDEEERFSESRQYGTLSRQTDGGIFSAIKSAFGIRPSTAAGSDTFGNPLNRSAQGQNFRESMQRPQSRGQSSYIYNMDFDNTYFGNNGKTDRDYLAPNRYTDQIKHIN